MCGQQLPSILDVIDCWEAEETLRDDHFFQLLICCQESGPAWLRAGGLAQLSLGWKASNAVTGVADDAVTGAISEADILWPNVRWLASALIPRSSLCAHWVKRSVGQQVHGKHAQVCDSKAAERWYLS